MLDVVVIGGGAAGTLAALKLASASKKVALVRKGYGALALCPGVVHLPRGNDKGGSSLQNSIALWRSALESGGLILEGGWTEDLSLMNEMGNIQRPAFALQSLARGDLAQWKGQRVALVDLEGLHHFPLERMREGILKNFGGLKQTDIEIRSLRFREWSSFGAVPLEVVSRGMDEVDLAMKLAQKIRDLVRRERFDRVGLPPILGVERHVEVYSIVQEIVEYPCFEWLPFSSGVVGLRWQRGIDPVLDKRGIERMEAKVVQPVSHKQRLSGVYVETSQGRSVLEAQNFILATGKFLGGGIPSSPPWKESIFGAPIYLGKELMGSRSAYSYLNPLALQPQPIFACGLRVDERMRPLNEEGSPLFENLHAAGSLLAEHDDTGSTGGMGCALASGYLAAEEILGGLA
ncbi:MAG: FAD-binding protein [Deltaproteobacteria bacterium]|nr:FAD-binding protein [Deltaproteobacteria bacterium]